MEFSFDEPALIAANLIEIALLIAGCIILHRWLLGSRSPSLKAIRLHPWSISVGDFLTRALFAVVGGLALQFLTQTIERQFKDLMDADVWLVLYNLAFQLGVLGGIFLGNAYHRVMRREAPLEEPFIPPDDFASAPVAPFRANALAAGLMVFLAALPMVALSGFISTTVLRAVGVNTEQQELVDMLTRSDSRLLVAAMATLAVVIAPIIEELVFRAGVFRYLRTRVPGISAYLISGIFFSALHANAAAFVPLVMFGIVLAFVYERTGRLAICMFAHAFFNLHTLAILLMTMKDQASSIAQP